VLAGRLEAGFEGDFYTHKIVTPMFTPEPQPHPFPKVFVAAVGEAMTEMCGEVADGLIAHAFTTKRYFEEVTTPALLRGMQRASRRRSEFQLSCPIFVVTGETKDKLAAGAVGTRKQIAFYGSTPAYRKVLELHGWGDLHTELHRLSLQGEWDVMGSLIDDEILEAFAVVAPLDTSASKIRDRCDGVIDRVLVGFPSSVPEGIIIAVLDELRGQSVRSRPDRADDGRSSQGARRPAGLRRRAETPCGADPFAGPRSGVVGGRAVVPAVLGHH